MSSYMMTTWIGNEFDKVVKEFSGSDEQVEQDDVSGEELVMEENRRAAEEQERKVRHEKVEKEREDARQKIRDKYNLKKKDDLSPKTKNHERGKIDNLITRIDNSNAKLEKNNGSESRGADPMKMKPGVFSRLKQTFGWK